MYPMLGYWGRWLKEAFGTSWAVSQTVSSVIGVMLFVIAQTGLIPKELPVNDWATWIGIGLLAVVLAFRLVAAPYWMEKEEAEKCAKIEGDLRAALANRDAELDSKARKRQIREQLARFLAEGQQLEEKCAAASKEEMAALETEGNEWLSRAIIFLVERLDESYAVRINDQTGIFDVHRRGIQPHQEAFWRGIYRRMVRLQEFIRELHD